MITTALIISGALLYHVASGAKSGAFYGRKSAWIHPAQLIETAAVGLIVMAATGGVLLTVGVMVQANVFFQGLINVGQGKPFIDPDEPPTYELGGVRIYKALTLSFPGWWRLLQAGLGTALIILGTLRPGWPI